jgi:hypothetical protein
MERNTGLLDDPKKAAYKELEDFVSRTIMFEDKPIHQVSLDELYHAYGKEAEKPLDKYVFMYKIAMDHPEFRLKCVRNEWYFACCDKKRLI